jgi:SAM-dependent methyltransferase
VSDPGPRFYDELAEWWPLLSPPGDYVEEAADLLARLGPRPAGREATLLELGSGGGSLAFHLAPHYRCTLTDLSTRMLAVNRALNPGCEHLPGDMRTVRLGRRFDVVLVHDAIAYATTRAELRATLLTCAAHGRPGGTVVVLPDHVRETFAPGTDHGGHDGPDGRGLRYLEWTWDPDPDDDTVVVDYAFLLRSADGRVEVIHDRHVEGLFPRAEWLAAFADAGLQARAALDRWGRDVFLATLDPDRARG